MYKCKKFIQHFTQHDLEMLEEMLHWFAPALKVNGEITSYACTCVSDIRLKDAKIQCATSSTTYGNLISQWDNVLLKLDSKYDKNCFFIGL